MNGPLRREPFGAKSIADMLAHAQDIVDEMQFSGVDASIRGAYGRLAVMLAWTAESFDVAAAERDELTADLAAFTASVPA